MSLGTYLKLAILLIISNISIAQESIRLTDVVKSNGTGKIDFFKDITASQLEQIRIDNNGMIIIGVDVNENASGTEKASSQAVTLGSLTLTITYSDNSQQIFDTNNGCCITETQSLIAQTPNVQRTPYYTLLGETGSSRITANNNIQEVFDSTIKIEVNNSLYNPEQGIEAISVVADIVWLDTNVTLGDPEAFYDYTNGFEDLALLNAEDAAFIDDYAAGRDEAIAVILTNPPTETDPMTVATWNYFPSASSYYLVGYEDLYPIRGDYDFNDLTVAYQLKYGLNSDNQVVTIRGTAYLITRGAAFNHDWHLKIPLPEDTMSTLSCTTYLEPGNLYNLQDCSPTSSSIATGTADIQVFSNTAEIFVHPSSNVFTNTLEGQSFIQGPKSIFRLDFDSPILASSIGEAPFDPYLFVRNTGRKIQLLQVNPNFKDENGFPFGMLMPVNWTAPQEFLSISNVYPEFDLFVYSEGTQFVDWYNFYSVDSIIPDMSADIWVW